MIEDIRPHYRLEAWKEAMALVRSVSELETQSLITHLASPQEK